MISNVIILSNQLKGNLEEQTKDSLKETGKGEVLDSLLPREAENTAWNFIRDIDKKILDIIYTLSIVFIIFLIIFFYMLALNYFYKQLLSNTSQNQVQGTQNDEEIGLIQSQNGEINHNLQVSFFDNKIKELKHLIVDFYSFCKLYHFYFPVTFLAFFLLFQVATHFPRFKFCYRVFFWSKIVLLIFVLISFLLHIVKKYQIKTARGIIDKLKRLENRDLNNNIKEYFTNLYALHQAQRETSFFIFYLLAFIISCFLGENTEKEFFNFEINLENEKYVLILTTISTLFIVFLAFLLSKSKLDLSIQVNFLLFVLLVLYFFNQL